MEEDSEITVAKASTFEKVANGCTALIVGVFGLWALVGLSYCALGDVTDNKKLEDIGWEIVGPLKWIMLAGLITLTTTFIVVEILVADPEEEVDDKTSE